MQRDLKTTGTKMTFGQKVEHIWEYYKPVLFGIVVAIAVIIYVIVRLVSPKPETVLKVTMINSSAYTMAEGDIFQHFMKQEGFDSDTQEVSVDSSLFLDTENPSQTSAASYQALIAMLMVGEIDLLTADEKVFQMVGSTGAMKAMTDILSAEELKKYQDQLFTATIEETGEEFVCGILLPADNPLTKSGYYGNKVLVGIPYTTERLELAQTALRYLLGEPKEEKGKE